MEDMEKSHFLERLARCVLREVRTGNAKAMESLTAAIRSPSCPPPSLVSLSEHLARFTQK